jgi:hypothetical protein
MGSRRETVVRLCEAFLPETDVRNEYLHWNQIGFDHIAKDYGQGSGTTCGFLPHWLLWRLGCRDNTLVNRSCPDEGLTFRIGENLSIFQPTAKRPRPSWVPLDTEQKTRDAAAGRGPAPGDFVIIRGGFWKDADGNRTRDSAHIFVLLDVTQADGKKVVWRVAQTGVSNDALQQGGQIKTLTGELREGEVLEGNQMHKGPNLVFVADILGEEPNFPRRVIGYNNLDAVSFGAAPDESFTRLFQNRRTEAAINGPNKIMEWLGWWQLEPANGIIPLAPTYLLLDRGHEAYRLQKVNIGPHVCTAAGVWTRAGSKLEVEWDDGSPRQSWTITKTFVPREKTEGTPLVPSAGPLTRLKKAPTELPARWLAA